MTQTAAFVATPLVWFCIGLKIRNYDFPSASEVLSITYVSDRSVLRLEYIQLDKTG